ncbi:hypothetical protein Psch_03367 [Pelotomaculum schinkii]|uniref:SAM-dependent methyltransferase n=1 Tax=Pelotomaculum schinkii TaxID=78350 RepID=A0A4Y7R767_9FIRM|nr:SAM-dependent methyltransferase [Pelotomaculum schinkii]TEB04606.1 hypothetical protein Psch_03367 [Pelotomaculum schinkii]
MGAIKIKEINKIPSSFRDPSGFLFLQDGMIFRQVNKNYQEHYELLMTSNLYQTLVEAELIVPHIETNIQAPMPDIAYKIIKPEAIPFISYPYEWCFSQLKNAALATLQIQKTALNFGMSLKDSSAYNIQFKNGKPVLIDTLSFEKYQDGRPWIAYKQFCQHFLAPLALMSYCDIRLNQLLRIYMDGIPLDLACNVLPFKSWFNFSLLSNIYLHASTQKKYEDKPINVENKNISRIGLLAILDNLESAVKKLKWEPYGTEWAEYYDDNNYSSAGINHKKKLVSEFLELINPTSVWDFGANTGLFSRIASNKRIPTLSFDIDPAAVEKNYLECINKNETNILPLLLDLTNPTPGIGWENTERASLLHRGPAHTIFALALVHHLAISNNLPLPKIAHFFSRMCEYLIIEFVPKSDSQVQRLLATREDIFPDYNQEAFEKEFSEFFRIKQTDKIIESERTLYLMRNITSND